MAQKLPREQEKGAADPTATLPGRTIVRFYGGFNLTQLNGCLMPVRCEAAAQDWRNFPLRLIRASWRSPATAALLAGAHRAVYGRADVRRLLRASREAVFDIAGPRYDLL